MGHLSHKWGGISWIPQAREGGSLTSPGCQRTIAKRTSAAKTAPVCPLFWLELLATPEAHAAPEFWPSTGGYAHLMLLPMLQHAGMQERMRPLL